MFGLIEGVFNLGTSAVSSTMKTVGDFVDSPVSTTVKIASQPIVDGCDLLQGLTEGEFRHKAALRLGADVVSGLAISEVIELMKD